MHQSQVKQLHYLTSIYPRLLKCPIDILVLLPWSNVELLHISSRLLHSKNHIIRRTSHQMSDETRIQVVQMLLYVWVYRLSCAHDLFISFGNFCIFAPFFPPLPILAVQFISTNRISVSSLRQTTGKIFHRSNRRIGERNSYMKMENENVIFFPFRFQEFQS